MSDILEYLDARFDVLHRHLNILGLRVELIEREFEIDPYRNPAIRDLRIELEKRMEAVNNYESSSGN